MFVLLEFKFDRQMIFSRLQNDQSIVEEQKSFLFKAISIAELIINTDSAKAVIREMYRVHADEFVTRLARLSIEFANWSESKEKLKIDVEGDKDYPENGYSWIDRLEKTCIFLNENFWKRFKITNSDDEKNRIIFFVSICIVHEIGHLSMQWTYDAR